MAMQDRGRDVLDIFVDAAAKAHAPKRVREARSSNCVDADEDENPDASEWLDGDRAAVEARLTAKRKR